MPNDDRPWLTADGACTVYLTYHSLPTAAMTVDRYDLCRPAKLVEGLTLDPLTSTRYVSFAPDLVLGRPGVYVLGSFGRPVVDTAARSPYRHRMYIPALDCPPLTLAQEVPRSGAEQRCTNGPAHLYVQISADRGRTWTLHDAAASPNGEFPIWAQTAAIDGAGNVYACWFDNQHAYLTVSRDGGSTWSSRRQIPTPGIGAVAYPTIAAGRGGDLRLSYYGTDRAANDNDTTVMGQPSAPGAAVWRLYVQRSSNGGRTFNQRTALETVHTGALCTEGDACSPFSAVRDLFDNFGIVVNPRTGEDNIAFGSDQPRTTTTDRHTDYATGTP